MRKSSRGNPWRYPAGDPYGRGGQFAPKGTSGAVAVECGKVFSETQYNAARNSISYQQQYNKHYGKQTNNRFSAKPSEAALKQAERTQKASGVPAPLNGTAIQVADYNALYRGAVEAPVGGQVEAVRKLEKKSGIPAPHNADAMSEQHAGAFIGMAKEVVSYRDRDSWVKEEDGNWYCYIKDSKGKSSRASYRIVPHHGKYRIEKRVTERRPKRDANGNIVRDKNGKIKYENHKYYAEVNDGKKNLNESMRFCANHKYKEYEKKYRNKASRRRSPETVIARQKHHYGMTQSMNWVQSEDGTLKYSGGVDPYNDSATFVVEPNEDGSFSSYRLVDYDTEAHGKVARHVRREGVGTKFKTQKEAMKACIEHDAAHYKREINPNAADAHEITKWCNAKDKKGNKKYSFNSMTGYRNFCKIDTTKYGDLG